MHYVNIYFIISVIIFRYLKARFPRRPWIDVVSKGDIEIPPDIEAQLPSNHLRISVKTNQNIDKLKLEVETMIYRLINMLNTMNKSTDA